MAGYADPPEETKFKPGESGNPAGKPKGTRNLSTILKEFLEEEIDQDGSKIVLKDAIVRKLIKKANSGNLRAIQEIFDRTEGKAKQEIRLDSTTEPVFNVKINKPDG